MSIHHSFNIEHAQFFGLPEAILISNLQFWISKNAANGAHQHDGRTWTYNSAKAFAELFPYFSDRQIRRTIDSLESQAVVLKGNYNTSACDRTLWLAFVDEEAFLAVKKPAPKSANGAPKKAKENAKPAPKSANGCAEIGESLISTDISTDVNLSPAAPTALPPEVIAPPVPAKQKKAKADDTQDTALQAACRHAWAAYSNAYAARYGTAPVRNAKVNANVKQFVSRLGYIEAPLVAAFFVERVGDAMVVRRMHEFGLLLQGAESYRTQWATGQSMTATRAQQADKTQSNYDAAQSAKALMRARREARNAE